MKTNRHKRVECIYIGNVNSHFIYDKIDASVNGERTILTNGAEHIGYSYRTQMDQKSIPSRLRI